VTQTNLPEGWYRDPSMPGVKRWWDGDAWTDHVRPDEDAGLGLGTPRAAGASAASAPVEPVMSPTTFAMPSDLAGTKPVSSVGSATAADSSAGDRWAAGDPA